MGREYSFNLLDNIVKQQYEEEMDGVKILVKPIPEGGADGDMDPRLYKSMKKALLFSPFMPKPKKESPIEETVRPLRQMFSSYKGTYIADEGVKTDYVTVASADGYEVPVRIYT